MIEVRALHVQHPGEVKAIDGVDLDLPQGQHVALMGANGSGKTTLIRCINGLLLSTSGSVHVDGLSPREPEDLIQIRRRVGMVFQNPDDQLVTTSVETEIAFGLENHGIPTDRMRHRVDEMLETFSLARYRNTPPHLLSGGERQRLAIAAAVALQPAYLLLDEPTALLDPSSRKDFMHLLDQLRVDHNIGILHVTQNAEEAILAQRLLVLNHGKLACDGSPEQVFSAGACLARETGIQLPFAVRCCLAVGSLSAPLPLTIEQLDDRLAHWQGPASPPAEGEIEEPTTPRMEIRHLHHIYDEGIPEPVQALTDIDLDINPGQILAIAGASGSGKTTLVQHLNGLLRPSAGQLSLDGLDLWDSRLKPQQLRRLVGLVFQFPEAQLFAETVAEDVAFGPRNVGFDEGVVAERVAAALHAVHLPHKEYGQRSPFHLSGGERRRVAIAGVLAMNPQILVLDEPTAGLDAQSTQLLIQIFHNLQRDQCSVVLVTHDMDLIAEVASRLVILANGRVAFDGSPGKAFGSDFFKESSPLIPPAAWRFSQLRQQREVQTPWLLTDAEVAAYARSLVPPLAESD